MQTLAVWRPLHNARPFSRTAGPRVTGCLLATFPLLELRLPFQLQPSPSGKALKRDFGGLLSASRAPETRLWELTTSHRTEPPGTRCGGGQVRVCRGGEPTAGQTDGRPDSGVPSRAAAGGAPPGRCRRKALGAVPGPALSGRRGSAAGSRGSAPGGGSGPGAASSARLGSGPGRGKEGNGDGDRGGGPGARRLAAGAGSASWRRRGAGAGVGGQGRAGPPAAGCARLPLMTVILRAMLQRGRVCGAARVRVYNAPGAPSAPRS